MPGAQVRTLRGAGTTYGASAKVPLTPLGVIFMYYRGMHRPKEDQNFWNFLFSLLFILVLAIAVAKLQWLRGSLPTSVPLFDAIMMGFASFRITRLIVYDKITRWFRELFADVREYEQDGMVMVEVKPFGSGLRHTIHDLLQCPWCIGFWGALIVAFFYFAFPWAWFVVFFIALSGFGSLIQLVANAIGWRAENLKLQTKILEEESGTQSDLTSLGK